MNTKKEVESNHIIERALGDSENQIPYVQLQGYQN